MYNLYGFVEIPNFASNSPGTTATVGELSSWGRLFSTEIGQYKNATYADVQLISIDSRRDEALVDVGLTYTDATLHVSQWLYDRSIQGQLGNDVAAIKQALSAQFGASMTILEVGPVVAQSGRYYFPAYISLTLTNSGEENTVYLWYSDEYFTSKVPYPRYEMREVLPVTPIDALMGAPEAVTALLKSITPASFLSHANTVAGQKSQSNLWSNEYEWHCLTNSDITQQCPLGVLINGVAGVNIDYIQEFLRTKILELSAHGVDDWRVVLPQLFKATEFLIIPLWDRKSLQNQDESTRLYSPTVRMKASVLKAYTDRYMPEFTAQWLDENLCITGSTYKNLEFLSCGNPDNYGAKYSFDEQFPEYAVVNTLTPEFSKIPARTRIFITKLTSLFLVAEEASTTSMVPDGFTRVVRNNVHYITFTYESCQYLCPIREGFMGA